MLSEALIAIQLIHPHLQTNVAQQYARNIDQQAVVAGVDPLTFVAIIEQESRFNQFAVSGDKKDLGLMQVRAQYFHGPANWLFNPVVNIQAGAKVIKSSVELCTKHFGRPAQPKEYIACYMGSCGSKESICRPTHKSTQREQYRDCLVDLVAERLKEPFVGSDLAVSRQVKECKSIYN